MKTSVSNGHLEVNSTHASFLRDCVVRYVVSRRLVSVSVFVFRSAIPAIMLRTESRRGKRREEVYLSGGKKLGS